MKPKALFLLFLVFLILIILSAYSSSLPDGLEWVINRFDSEANDSFLFQAPFSFYTFSSEFSDRTNQMLSAILGIGIIFSISLLYSRLRQHTIKGNRGNRET
jgi:hypothetical protein